MKLSIILPLLQSALLVAGGAAPEAAPEAIALPEVSHSPDALASLEDVPNIVPKVTSEVASSEESALDLLLKEYLAQRLAKSIAEPSIADANVETSPNNGILLPLRDITLDARSEGPSRNNTNGTCPGSCSSHMRRLLYPFRNMTIAQQMCAKVARGQYKYQKSYAFMSSWIGKDIKRFCCCIAGDEDEQPVNEELERFTRRSIDAQSAADLGNVFEKRRPERMSDIIQEARELSQSAPNGVLEKLHGLDKQSYYGPSRMYGYGGSLIRTRRTTVRTVVEVTTEE